MIVAKVDNYIELSISTWVFIYIATLLNLTRCNRYTPIALDF